MGRSFAARLAATLLVLAGAAALLFALTLLIPGNPAQVLLGPRATPEAVAAYGAAMGLDQPVWVQLLRFFGHVLRGDLGTDVVSGRKVLAMVLDVLPNTLALTGAAIGLALLGGVPLGILAAARPGSRADSLLALLSVSMIAVPSFVVAIVLLLVFSIWLQWLPVLGHAGGGAGDSLLRLVLPSVSLALGWVGYIARLLRASLLETLGADHVRTLRAYGVPERRILFRYALKLASIPLVAVLGLGIGRLLGGAIFTEIVFARPGLGTLIFDAIGTRDYPVVQGAVLVAVVLFVAANLAVEALLAWLDPRMAEPA
jgi:peptide/nickel transport system permease protein